MRLVLRLIVIAAFVSTGPSLAQKLVDPNSVAPEFRDAAENGAPNKSGSWNVTARPMSQRSCPGIEPPTSTIALKLQVKSTPSDPPPREALARLRGLGNNLRATNVDGGVR